ncbi:MAG: hypothetical protein GOV15_03575, partial [Candidatus Diapherotrites archaeon]|nr:hypothetical protein [Candidatus Diapherotrites archaeon]
MNKILVLLVAMLMLTMVVTPLVSAQDGATPVLISDDGSTTVPTDVDEVTGEIDELTVVTEDNYADAIVADSASAHEGAPIAFTPGHALAQEVKDMIRTHNIKKIRLLGGPLAISEDVEAELEAEGVEVRRIWGHTRFGTAAELAKDAWPEGIRRAVLTSDHAGVAVGRNYRFATAARQLALARGEPLLLTDPDGLSSEVVDAITDLGVEEITVVGDEVSDDVVTDLQDLGLTVTTIAGDEEEDLEENIDDTIEQEITDVNETGEFNQRAFVIIAVKEWKDVLKHANNPFKRARVKLVQDEEDIPRVVALAQEKDFRKIVVTGFPELANQINDALIDAGFEPELHIKRPREIVKEVLERKKEEWKEVKEKLKENEDELRARLAEKAAEELEEA